MRNLDMAKDRISKDSTAGPNSSRFIIITASFTVIAVIIISLSFYTLLKSQKSMREKLAAMEAGVLKMEERLARMESTDKSNSKIDEQRTKLEISLMDRMESIENLFNAKIRKTGKDTLHSEASEKTAPVKEAVKTSGDNASGYHIVVPGETLYRISINNNISVNELRRLNNIGPQSVIHVGQKLRVSK